MELELYQMETCTYCAKVRRKLTELGLSFTAHNPRANEDRMEELLELGGKDQVPFLVARDQDGAVVETLYESDEILEWLDEEFGR